MPLRRPTGKRCLRTMAYSVVHELKSKLKGGCGTKADLGFVGEYRTMLKADGPSGNSNTTFVERVNLTIRQSVSKLTRSTWGTAQHESLRVRLQEPMARKGKQRAKEHRKVTPAVAAGLISRRWSVMELTGYPLP